MTDRPNPEIVRGRCLAIEPEGRVQIATERGMISTNVQSAHERGFKTGDLLEIEAGEVKVLTPNRTPDASIHWARHILDPRRLRAMDIRSQVESGIRSFFREREFREVKTPILVPCPGMEPHIRPFRISGREPETFLPTSPEFAMKRLLVGGLEKIFQLSPAFRDEPSSITHRPEFTMLEWYRAYAGYEDLMRDTEALFESLAKTIFGQPSIPFQGQKISVAAPWPRLRTRDLFRQQVGIDLLEANTTEELANHARRLGLRISAGESWDDIYFNIWLNRIEPNLPADQAVFVTDYPPSQAALSVIGVHEDGTPWAKRFEAYVGGLELCNAFQELTDPVEQRQRFVEDMELRTRTYGPSFPKNPIDEEFLEALAEGMPPSSGNALGVDRLVMLFADEPDIHYTLWLS